MLQPYIVDRGVLRLVGRSAGARDDAGMDRGIAGLYEHMDEIFAKIPEPSDRFFYGVSCNFDGGGDRSRRTYWLCKAVETYWQPDAAEDEWHTLAEDMETLTLPATRWLYIPTRYDDPFVLNLAPPEHQGSPATLTPHVWAWGARWLRENGYRRQDYPFEMEIYGLHKGYDGVEGGANLTLAIPMV